MNGRYSYQVWLQSLLHSSCSLVSFGTRNQVGPKLVQFVVEPLQNILTGNFLEHNGEEVKGDKANDRQGKHKRHNALNLYRSGRV
jgi:hypothetical protein